MDRFAFVSVQNDPFCVHARQAMAEQNIPEGSLELVSVRANAARQIACILSSGTSTSNQAKVSEPTTDSEDTSDDGGIHRVRKDIQRSLEGRNDLKNGSSRIMRNPRQRRRSSDEPQAKRQRQL